MFLKTDYRISAVAVVAALAVLLTGVVATGAVATTHANTPAPVSAQDATQAVNVAQDWPSGLDCASVKVC